MRANALVWCSVLILGGLVGPSCRKESGNGAGGPGEEPTAVVDGGSGERPDGWRDGGDGQTPDAGETVSGCAVWPQQGCDTGALCLRGVLEDGGQGNRCFPGGCDPVAKDCPEGNKCTYVRRDGVTSRQCVPDGTVAEGGACQSTATPEGAFYDTCQAGLSCVDEPAADGGTAFVCRRFCHGDEQCTAPRECLEVLRFEGSEERPRVCGEPGPRCDLLAQDCASTLGCYPSRTSGPVCVTAGMLEDGAPCAYSNDCRPGSACVGEGGGLVCRPLCRDPSGEPSCATGRCEPLRDFAGVGACVP